MSRKIKINNLESIKILFKDDCLIVYSPVKESFIEPLTSVINHYFDGSIVLLAPEKAKIIKSDDIIPDDPYKLSIGDNILFDKGLAIPIIVGDAKNEYFLINKKDIIFVYNG